MSPRPLIFESDGTVWVPLSRGLRSQIDPEDADFVGQWTWSALIGAAHRIYAVRTFHKPRRTTVYLHRALFAANEELQIDHVNGNGLDNRRENLRFCTHVDNGKNQKKTVRNKSGFKGVSWHKITGKWQARIKANGKQHFLGDFSDPAEASVVYEQAAESLFGSFKRAVELY